jgi:hypothetical protein
LKKKQNFVKSSHIHVIQFLKREDIDNGTEKLFEEIMANGEVLVFFPLWHWGLNSEPTPGATP